MRLSTDKRRSPGNLLDRLPGTLNIQEVAHRRSRRNGLGPDGRFERTGRREAVPVGAGCSARPRKRKESSNSRSEPEVAIANVWAKAWGQRMSDGCQVRPVCRYQEWSEVLIARLKPDWRN